MRDIPPALAAHLASGATTLCWCWKLVRRDGVVFGFTDHDRDITFDAVTYEAAAGLTATEVKESVGLGIDNLEVEGALRSDRLAAADLAAGRYDGASIDIFRVNWQAPAERVLIRRGSIGEVRRTTSEFVAEESAALRMHCNNRRGAPTSTAATRSSGTAAVVSRWRHPPIGATV